MSASSAARISSGLTLGCVWASGMVEPSSSLAVQPRVDLDHHVVEAGLRPQSSVASSSIRCATSSRSPSSPSRALLELDPVDVPDLDACEVDRLPLSRCDGLGGREFAFSSNASSPRSGTHDGSAVAWLARIPSTVTIPATSRATTAITSAQVLSERSSHGAGGSRQAQWPQPGRVRSGWRCLWQATYVWNGGRAPSSRAWPGPERDLMDCP